MAPSHYSRTSTRQNPEPTHPDRDPTTQPASPTYLASEKADNGAWWEEEDGQEYIRFQQYISSKHISKYFRTRSTVSAADIDGWREQLQR
jgi:hypothetical protein